MVETLEQFLAAAWERQMRGAAMQVVDELRPRLRGAAVEVGRQRFVDVIGYASGVVVTARLPEADPDQVETTLTAAGLRVRRRSANLG